MHVKACPRPSRRPALRLLAACLLAPLASAMAAPPAAPRSGDVPHVEGRVGALKFSLRAPVTMEESLAAMKSDTQAPVAEFGRTTVNDRRGFRQLVIDPKDRRSMLLVLSLTPDQMAALQPGVVTLGGTTLQVLAEGSNDGWSGECPDHAEGTPILEVMDFAPPAKGAPVMPGAMIPPGSLERVYQTHLNRLRKDKATLEIRRLDRAAGFVEGRLVGEASWLVAKEGADKLPKYQCSASNYRIESIDYDVSFGMKFKP